MNKEVDVSRESAKPETKDAPSMWEPLHSLRSQIDRLFDDANWHLPHFGRTATDVEQFPQWGRMDIKLPAVDVVEEDGHYQVTAEMPGITEDDIEVVLHENVLTVKGEKRQEHEEKKGNTRMSERQYGSFRRSFRLPADADPDNISATCRDGVLTVAIPRTSEPVEDVRKIEVKAS